MHRGTLIAKAEQFAKATLAHADPGHDWWHIVRVRNNAHLINRTEKSNPFVIDLAVLLHDVGDHKVIQKSEDDYAIAESFLRTHKVAPTICDEVMRIISNMSFSKTLNNKKIQASKEFYIVQDADRLDAIGAIGIARAFAYGSTRGAPLFDPSQKARVANTRADYRAGRTSTLHHFEEKLFLLRNLMNTKTAQKIAQKRHTFMRQYHAQFLAEWYGKK